MCGAMYDTDYRVYVAPSSRIYDDVSQSVRRIYMTGLKRDKICQLWKKMHQFS